MAYIVVIGPYSGGLYSIAMAYIGMAHTCDSSLYPCTASLEPITEVTFTPIESGLMTSFLIIDDT